MVYYNIIDIFEMRLDAVGILSFHHSSIQQIGSKKYTYETFDE